MIIYFRLNYSTLIQLNRWTKNSPDDIKKGIRKRPDSTLSRNDCNVDPSKGSAPQTSTYKTTPSDCIKKKMKIDIVGYGIHIYVDKATTLVCLNHDRNWICDT